MRARRSFLRSSWLLGVVVPIAAASLWCSSTSTRDAAGVVLEPTILGPKTILDQIAVFSLQVYPAVTSAGGTISCAASTTGLLSGDATAANALLRGTGDAASPDGHVIAACSGGATRCFPSVSVPQSATVPRVFAVTGYSDAAATKLIANGCVQQLLPPPPDGGNTTLLVPLTITMQPVATMMMTAAVCGNGILEVPETCDPGGMEVAQDGGSTQCFAPSSPEVSPVCCGTCQTIEELLSNGSNGSNTATGSPGDKTGPSFLWPSGGNFFAFFNDASEGSPQIAMRVLGADLASTNAFMSSVVQDGSLFLPNATPFPSTVAPNPLKQPAAAQLGGASGLTYVAFADAVVGSLTNAFEINLRSMDDSLTAQQTNPCNISDPSTGDGGAGGSETSPAIAANSTGTALYIAWEDGLGDILGRTYTPAAGMLCGKNGTQQQLSTGASNSHVSLAPIPGGWIAAWQSGTDVVVRPINTFGAPSSPQVTVEGSGHSGAAPTVASLAGSSAGDFAVAWADQTNGGASTIFAQRYLFTMSGSTGSTTPVGAPAAISTSNNGGEVSPFVAASPAVNGSYVVTWVDQGSPNQVRARLLAGTAGSLGTASGTGTGFLQNAVDGTTGEFQVSLAAGHPRSSPTVAVGGGSGQYMAFGWVDNQTAQPYGIIARRFPLPTQ